MTRLFSYAFCKINYINYQLILVKWNSQATEEHVGLKDISLHGLNGILIFKALN